MSIRQYSAAGLRRRTLISFGIFILFGVFAYMGWQWVKKSRPDEGIQRPLRVAMEANEKLFSPLTDSDRLVRTYPVTQAEKRIRFNGSYGLRTPVDSNWQLHLVRKPGDTLLVDMNTIKAMPRTEIVFDFKCIEGWSQKTHWGGVRFRDFMDRMGLKAQEKLGYVGLVTPDGAYYVGIDMASALHPQTLLAYEVNDRPLPVQEGYPLRLIIPVKYGIKHLKRIGTMHFSNEKPKDYWAERGYDYHSGH